VTFENPYLEEVAGGVTVGAITDSQTVHHVQRELRVDRETTTKLLDATGLLEQLGTGCAPILPRDAERAVQEVSG
jgi:hypothetical protein